jgi:hypothetical protein
VDRPEGLDTTADIQRSHAARREKYAAIRRDTDNGMSGRTIERKHHVNRRTIVTALASAAPLKRKKIHSATGALNGLHGHIGAKIAADLKVTTVTILQRLADQHGSTAAYYTLST